MAKISIVVPIYNNEIYLEECIESIINQTLTDLEIILVDDGSTDKSPKIIDEYARKDNRIVVIHKENDGLGPSMNIGLNRATGEYIGIVESDDYIATSMYEDLYKIAKKFDSDIVKSDFYDNLQSKEEQRILKVKWDDDKIPQNRSFNINECGLFLQYHPSVWTCIYKREFLQANNICYPNVAGASWADNPFQVQTMCLAKRINYTPQAYYYWRRINKNDSDDLKDYKIPFDRSDEIHRWLEENDIKSNEILKNLYIREIAYIRIVLGMKKISNIDDCLLLIKNLCDRVDRDIILNSSDIKKRYKKSFRKILTNPLNFRKEILFKNFKKNLISIHWNKHEKRIVLFGKTIFKNKETLNV